MQTLTSLAACGSATQEKVISAASTTSDGVKPCSAPAFTKSAHYKKYIIDKIILLNFQSFIFYIVKI